MLIHSLPSRSTCALAIKNALILIVICPACSYVCSFKIDLWFLVKGQSTTRRRGHGEISLRPNLANAYPYLKLSPCSHVWSWPWRSCLHDSWCLHAARDTASRGGGAFALSRHIYQVVCDFSGRSPHSASGETVPNTCTSSSPLGICRPLFYDTGCAGRLRIIFMSSVCSLVKPASQVVQAYSRYSINWETVCTLIILI